MDLGSSSPLYEIEIWSQSGQRIDDISALCHNISYTITRNDAETLQFDIDVNEFERRCKDVLGGIDPKYLLQPYVSDIKVKRAGQYLFGSQVVMISYGNQDDTFTATVKCTGYLNLFKDRYVTASYTGMERVAIACAIINLTQSQTNGSLGVTLNSSQYSTGFTDSQRTYSMSNVKSSLQNLANISDYPFDFNFRYDKVFNTYSEIGADRSGDISFIYGGELGNVKSFSMDRDASQLFNKIYGIGSGIGDAALTSTAGDATSQLNYYLREEIAQFNSVVIQDTLDRNTATELAVHKDILSLPKITVVTPQLSGKWISVGDKINIRVNDHTWLDDINGKYRVEQMSVSVDDNDLETITYTVDDYGVV